MIDEVNTYDCNYLLMQIIRQLSKEIDLLKYLIEFDAKNIF